MPSDEDAAVLEWEEIPDDVLVPTRTKRRRHRFREGFAPDVLRVGQTRRVRARVDDAFAALFTASDPRARETARRGRRARARVSTPRAPRRVVVGRRVDRRPRVGGGRGAADRDPPDPVDVLAAHLSAAVDPPPPIAIHARPDAPPRRERCGRAYPLELRPPRPDDRRDFYRKKRRRLRSKPRRTARIFASRTVS